MKAYFFMILVFFLSCMQKKDTTISTKSNQFEFKLIDGLGSVSIDIPERTDTFFSWIQTSDCGKPCEHGDYRFQSKANRIFKESGFFWFGEPEDSVDQLSIYHQRPDTLIKFSDSLILNRRTHIRKNLLANPRMADILSDTLQKIGDRNFLIFRIADFDTMKQCNRRMLIGFTTISGSILEFDYKLLTKMNDSVLIRFFDKSMENLATVRLKDGVNN